MPFSNNDIKAIQELYSLDQNDLVRQTIEISKTAWDNVLDTPTIHSWIGNFKGEYLGNDRAEQNLALWILENYVFYTDRDVRAMAKNMWWKYLHYHLLAFQAAGFMEGSSISEKIKYVIENTIIQPLGNCSGSGTNVAYCFRQTNRLDPKRFNIVQAKNYRYLVLLDDATLSGHQAEENLKEYDAITEKDKFILTYISSKNAKSYLDGKAVLLSSIELNERSKCFHADSLVFCKHPNWIPVAKKMCEHYGNKLDPYNPLGYRKGQYTFGFYYNTPNNTLPIFWGTLNGWIPLFTRYFSNELGMEDTDDEKFY